MTEPDGESPSEVCRRIRVAAAQIPIDRRLTFIQGALLAVPVSDRQEVEDLLLMIVDAAAVSQSSVAPAITMIQNQNANPTVQQTVTTAPPAESKQSGKLVIPIIVALIMASGGVVAAIAPGCMKSREADGDRTKSKTPQKVIVADSSRARSDSTAEAGKAMRTPQ